MKGLKKEGRKVKSFVAANRIELAILVLILLVGGFLRFYRLPEYMTFLGDEGRDALAVKRIIVDHKFRLIGPVTSIGNMYLGPLYYYLVTPAMVVSGLSPVGPAAFVALLGVITVGLVWWVGRDFFNRVAGLVAAGLYAISPVAVIYARSSWNPNVMPFFAILTIWGIWGFWVKKQFWWLPVIGMTLSFALQSHYLGLLLVPTVGAFWFLTLIKIIKKKQKTKSLFFYSFILLFLFIILTVVPLVWFDLRHSFINFNALKAFFTVRQVTVNLKVYKGLSQLWELTVQAFTRLLAGKDKFWGKWLTLLTGGLVALLTLALYQTKEKKVNKERRGLALILVWFLVGLLGLGNYKQHIYDHYFGFFFPAPFLLVGWCLGRLGDLGKLGRLAGMAVLVLLAFLALKETPVRYAPNDQLGRTKRVARFIIDKADGQPFNLALIAERNYHAAYAYFMEIWGTPATEIDPQKISQTLANQLFVICEQLPCQPINHPLAEIANFGWAEVERKWVVEGVEVYQLVHTQ